MFKAFQRQTLAAFVRLRSPRLALRPARTHGRGPIVSYGWDRVSHAGLYQYLNPTSLARVGGRTFNTYDRARTLWCAGTGNGTPTHN